MSDTSTVEAVVAAAIKKRTGGKIPFRVVAMLPQGSLTPSMAESRYGKRPYINCGKDNLFLEFCRGMADNCGPLGASHNTMTQYVAGQGLEWLDKDGNPVEKAYEVARRWFAHSSEKTVLNALASDVALLQAKVIDIAPSRDGKTAIAAIYHKDVCRLRLLAKQKVADEYGVECWKVPGFVWCVDWEQGTKKSWEALKADDRLRPEETKAFDWTNPSKKEKTSIYARQYRQNTEYYGLPWWLPAVTSAEVWAAVPTFDRTQIYTGFRPAFHIHIFSDKDDVDMVQLRQEIEDNLTGPNGQAFTLTVGTVAEGAPTITKLERGDHAGELLDLMKRHADVVYEAYGVPKILMNVEVNTGLSGKGIAIVEEEASFIKRSVEPLQSLITDDFLKLMVQVEGVKEVATCRIKQNTVFNSKTDQELMRMRYLRMTTVNEARTEAGLDEDPTVKGKYLIEMAPSGQQQQSNG